MKLKENVKKFLDYFLGIPLLIVLSFVREVLRYTWRPFVRFFWTFSSSQARSTRPRILILKLDHLNEAVAMLAAIRLLRKELPNAHITFLGSQKNASFFSKTKMLDRIEVFSYSTFWDMTRGHYMMVLDFQRHSRISSILTSFFKTPLSIGFNVSGAFRHFAYDEVKKYKEKLSLSKNFWHLAKEAIHACGHVSQSEFGADQEYVFEALRPLLYENSFKNIEFKLPQNYVVFNLAGPENIQARLLPEQSWIKVMEKIKAQNNNTEFLLVGHDSEQDYTQLQSQGAKLWIGKLSFDELFQVLHNASEVYSIDNEFINLCVLLNRKLTVFLGPTTDLQFEGLNNIKILKSYLQCAPCGASCADPVCMKAIEL
ncbi:MAG: glycosyltransferase family 9 protein [Oligoflexia bacterium]|nr:glycosyltransferase family 9 protein [Oligoflexia bacterium]